MEEFLALLAVQVVVLVVEVIVRQVVQGFRTAPAPI